MSLSSSHDTWLESSRSEMIESRLSSTAWRERSRSQCFPTARGMSARSLICWPMRRLREVESTRREPALPRSWRAASRTTHCGWPRACSPWGAATVTGTGWPRPARRDPLTTPPDGQAPEASPRPCRSTDAGAVASRPDSRAIERHASSTSGKPEGGGDRDLGRRDPAVLPRAADRRPSGALQGRVPEPGLATTIRESAQRFVVLYDVGRLDGEAGANALTAEP
jgi:hypothetical protein